MEIYNDWFLQDFITKANNFDIEIGVTLTINGFLVSGILIGGKTYMDLLSKDMSAGLKNGSYDENSSDLIHRLYMSSGFRAYYKLDEPESGEEAPPHFIHLKNAVFYSSSVNQIPNQGCLWRGRVSEVVGFTLGNLHANH